MSKQVSIALTVSCGGDGVTTYTYVPPASPLVNNNAPEAVPQSVVLTTGANTIPVPAGATQCILVPPTGSAVAKNAKTTSGDVGLAFTGTPVLFPLAGVTNVFVQAGAGETISVVWG